MPEGSSVKILCKNLRYLLEHQVLSSLTFHNKCRYLKKNCIHYDEFVSDLPSNVIKIDGG